MFERYTDRARRVVVLAQEEARMLNHDYIGTEHLLLGLIHEGDGVAAKALEALGISLGGVRAQVEEVIGRGQQAPTGHIPFTPRAKKALELSLREALQLGHNYIGTEHVLLGLIREGEGVAAQVLVKLGAELIRVRQEVIRLVSGGLPRASVDEQIAALALEADILRARLDKEALIDAHDFVGAAEARKRQRALEAERRAGSGATTVHLSGGTEVTALKPKVSRPLGELAVTGKHFAPDAPMTPAERAGRPKVSVDQSQFEELKKRLAYVVEDPFSGELRLHSLKWTGRVITGVDWADA